MREIRSLERKIMQGNHLTLYAAAGMSAMFSLLWLVLLFVEIFNGRGEGIFIRAMGFGLFAVVAAICVAVGAHMEEKHRKQK